MTRIYLDHAATTPLRPEAREAMLRGFDIWANPSSPHAEGRKARAALEDARERVKATLGWEGEVIFTGGATGAALIGLGCSQVERLCASTVEHDAVRRGEGTLDFDLPVRSDGAVDTRLLPVALDDQPTLVAVQQVNSETGNRQDLAAVSAGLAGKNAMLLVDCAQGAGKFALPREADMAIVSAHKFGGPIGVGALLVREYGLLFATGGQERGYRRGTENLPDILGMAAALEACNDPYIDPGVLEPLDAFAAEVRAIGGDWLSDRLSDPTPYIRALAMPNMTGTAQVMRFDMAGIDVSQGSACSSGTMKTSHVLKALGLGDDLAGRTIRVSFGWSTSRAEVERFCETWLAMAREAAEGAA
ncbi:aminotransferase class V-fold PLP-dependent enzyme [Altererythrobacter salegens]|uniref:Cysteine desulfurase n=1 Tax=Croceibacterium salegens TaxID=1737568 RepID=A0A6I4SXW5_9SPHN|nr:aminotransferase class V-fold PLP-dependent enzyme [Croceibacterium salegens]MXO60189.1 aminotransferase class V-fold PLP-dependent enzyme [Croceibacterium salegens]